jgi:hypothetical protein
LTFKVPAAYQNTVAFQIEGNKIPPKFAILFATPLEAVWLFKGLNAHHLKSFGIKGLIQCTTKMSKTAEQSTGMFFHMFSKLHPSRIHS